MKTLNTNLTVNNGIITTPADPKFYVNKKVIRGEHRRVTVLGIVLAVIIAVAASFVAIPRQITYTYLAENGTELTEVSETIQARVWEGFTLPERSYENYTVEGWVDANGEAAESASYVLTNRAYTLKLAPKTYAVKYELNGGELTAEAASEYTFGTELAVNAEAKKDNFSFEGWADAEGNKVESIAEGTSGDITLYAQFAANTYKVNYELNGGALKGAAEEFTYGEGVEKLAAPTRNGYNFLGWYADANFKTKVNAISEDANEDVTLYARWEKVQVAAPVATAAPKASSTQTTTTTTQTAAPAATETKATAPAATETKATAPAATETKATAPAATETKATAPAATPAPAPAPAPLPEGNGGRIDMNGYSALLYKGSSQGIVDAAYSAAIFGAAGKTVIADHSHQGFSAITWNGQATITVNGVKHTIVRVSMYNGQNLGTGIVLNDGRNALTVGDGTIMMYTCADAAGVNVYVTYWVYIN